MKLSEHSMDLEKTDDIVREPGEMTSEEQVDEWVKGNSIHNNNRWTSIVDENNKIVRRELMKDGECCPDFSCCSPHLAWSPEMRQAFKDADQQTRGSMMGMSISALMADEKIKVIVKVAGEPEQSRTLN